MKFFPFLLIFFVATAIADEQGEKKKLAMTTIKGEFTIKAPPTKELLDLLDAIQSTKKNDECSMEQWQISFLKTTGRLRNLVEIGAIAEASFKIDSSSELVALDEQNEGK